MLHTPPYLHKNMSEKTQERRLHDLWAAWERAQMGILSSATLRRYRSVFIRFAAWFDAVEHHPPTLNDWHPITLVGYRSWLTETYSPNTVNTHISAFRTWGEWLVEQGYKDANPALRLKLVQFQEKAAPSALKPKQVNALLRAAQHTRYPERNQAVLQMMLHTGIRIGECAALKWGDIEYGERRGFVTIRLGKGNKTRRVPLNKSIRQALADYVAPILKVENSLQDVAAVWSNQSPGEPLWKSERGSQLSAREMSRMIQQLVQDCARRGSVPPDTTPHYLRHTFATRYLKRHRGDLVGLAWLLGHSSVRTTQVYVQPTEEEIIERVSQIDLNAYAD
jgi:site-specific recombinase XerD